MSRAPADTKNAERGGGWHVLTTLPIRRPWVTIGITIILCLLAIVGAARLRPDTSLDRMFNPKDPSAQAMLHILNEFSSAEELLILASIPEGTDGGALQLKAFAERLESDIAHSPDASAMCSGVEWRVNVDTRRFIEEQIAPAGLFYLDGQAMQQVRQRVSPEGIRAQLARARSMLLTPGPAGQALGERFLKDPLAIHELLIARFASLPGWQMRDLSGAFLSPDGRSLLIRIRATRPPSDIAFSRRLTTTIQQLADHANTAKLQLAFTGGYPIASASEHAIRGDMSSSATSSIICMQLLFILLYRRPLTVFALAFLPVVLGVLLGFGMQSCIDRSLTPMTAAIGGILAGMAIDYSVHVMSHYEAYRRQGHSSRDAAARMLPEVWPAAWAAWLTSIIGFAVLALADIPAIRQFALTASLGLSAAFVGALSLLPSLLVIVDRRPAERVQQSNMMRLPLAGAIGWIGQHRRWCIAACGIALAGSLVLLACRRPVLPMEQDVTIYHPRPNPALDAQALICRKMGTSPDALLIRLSADSPDHLLALAHTVRTRLHALHHEQPTLFQGTLGLGDLLPDPGMTASRATALASLDADAVIGNLRQALDESGFAAEQFEPYMRFLRELLDRRQPPGMHEILGYPGLAGLLLPKTAVEQHQPPIQAIQLVFAAPGDDSQAHREAVLTAIRSSLNGLDGAVLTGLSVLGQDMQKTVHRDLPRLLLASTIAVLVYLLIHFRSLGRALLALLPTVGAMLLLLAAANLAGQRLNTVNLIAAPLLVGIGVDYGIFLVAMAGSRRSGSRPTPQEIEPTVSGILTCALTTILGFGSLYFTSVPAIQSLGFAVGVGMSACLILTFLLALPLALAPKRAPLHDGEVPPQPPADKATMTHQE